MTILEEDLTTIRVTLMQKRNGYHISDNDIKELEEALNRINQEAQEIL